VVLDRLNERLGLNKLLTYQRITIGLTRQRLDELKLYDVNPVKVREMDAVDQIANMQRVGAAVAAEQVHMERLIRFFSDKAMAASNYPSPRSALSGTFLTLGNRAGEIAERD
jgi:hypothetical protein